MNQNSNKNNSNKPKKPIIYYYAVVMLVLAMLNLVMVPFMKTAQIEDANYSTFVKETNKGNVKEVQEQSNQILYMLKDSKTVYRTGKFNDPDLMTRLEDHNVDFTAEIVEETSPFLQFLMGWIIPIFFATLLLRALMSRGSQRIVTGNCYISKKSRHVQRYWCNNAKRHLACRSSWNW